MQNPFQRRHFLAGSLAAGASLACSTSFAEDSDRIAFVYVSDTHYVAKKEAPSEIDERTTEVCSRLIDTLNRLPGQSIAEEAGGGKVIAPQGVLHGGDVIDSGDKSGAVHDKMQQTEWDAFVADYGLTGKEGRLKYPVYEIHGNHDGPQARGLAPDAMRERTKKRPGVKAVSKDGLHYSWDWGPAHFVNLGIVVGTSSDKPRQRRYDPRDSLAFLIEDLKANVGESGRPVVLSHHVDVARYATGCDAAAPYSSKEWDPCDVAAYYDAIAKYNIAAVFYGHTHARQIHSWDGQSLKAKQGIGLFNVDNSSHFNSQTQAFYYVELSAKDVLVREYATTDRWQTGNWTSAWRRSLSV
jgi:hypothetical protein